MHDALSRVVFDKNKKPCELSCVTFHGYIWVMVVAFIFFKTLCVVLIIIRIIWVHIQSMYYYTLKIKRGIF